MPSAGVESDRTKPTCFGNADRVCPRNEEGFIEPQADCLRCEHVRACLQAALAAEGTLKAAEVESVEPESSIARFLRRWSERKRTATRPHERPGTS